MTLLFYYTLLIMFFYTIVAATSLSAFYVSRRRTFLYATVGFAFYFFDVSLVFKDNFITPDAVFEAASFYDVGHPYTSIITGGGAFLFLWLPACRYCGKNAPSFALRPWHCGPRCRWPPISSSRTRNGGSSSTTTCALCCSWSATPCSPGGTRTPPTPSDAPS